MIFLFSVCCIRIFGHGHCSASARRQDVCVCVVFTSVRRTNWTKNHRIEYMNIIYKLFRLCVCIVQCSSAAERQLRPANVTRIDPLFGFYLEVSSAAPHPKRKTGINYARLFVHGRIYCLLFSPVIFNFLRFLLSETIWNELPNSVRLFVESIHSLLRYVFFVDYYYYYRIDGCNYDDDHDDNNIDTKPVRRHFKKAPTPYPIQPRRHSVFAFSFAWIFRRCDVRALTAQNLWWCPNEISNARNRLCIAMLRMKYIGFVLKWNSSQIETEGRSKKQRMKHK